jgi:hypothetical protein
VIQLYFKQQNSFKKALKYIFCFIIIITCLLNVNYQKTENLNAQGENGIYQFLSEKEVQTNELYYQSKYHDFKILNQKTISFNDNLFYMVDIKTDIDSDVINFNLITGRTTINKELKKIIKKGIEYGFIK